MESSNIDENINKSSLISLKAELLRKKQLVKAIKTKLNPENSSNKNKTKTSNDSSVIQNFSQYREKPIKKLNINDKLNKDITERIKNDIKNKIDKVEEEQELKESQNSLLAKTEIYNELMKGKNVLDNKNQILVNFDKKCEDELNEKETAKDENEEDYDDDSDNEWTEFTDALGRTRRCLKEDLAHFKKQDKYLEDLKPTSTKNETEIKCKEQPVPIPDNINIELLSADMRREILRQQWEEQEEKLKDKSNIHYQDILFEEARQHGVGYFTFSKDEQERAIQLKKLNEMRTETKNKRIELKEIRKLRKKQFKMRLIITENRKRESQGLPPLELKEDEISSDEEDDKEKEAKEKEKQMDDLIARKLEEIKKSNKTREWDVGKDGQMSQEQWVEKQRELRIEEFAPPTEPDNVSNGTKYDKKQHRKRKIFDNTNKVNKSDASYGTVDSASHDSSYGTVDSTERVINTSNKLIEENNPTNEDMNDATNIYCFNKKWNNEKNKKAATVTSTNESTSESTKSTETTNKKIHRPSQPFFIKKDVKVLSNDTKTLPESVIPLSETSATLPSITAIPLPQSVPLKQDDLSEEINTPDSTASTIEAPKVLDQISQPSSLQKVNNDSKISTINTTQEVSTKSIMSPTIKTKPVAKKFHHLSQPLFIKKDVNVIPEATSSAEDVKTSEPANSVPKFNILKLNSKDLKRRLQEGNFEYCNNSKMNKPEIVRSNSNSYEAPRIKRGAEIAPPSTSDYYGTNSFKNRQTKPKLNLKDSVNYGSKKIDESKSDDDSDDDEEEEDVGSKNKKKPKGMLDIV